MKKLFFNDGKSVEVQSVASGEGNLKVRLILQTSESLKALFSDSFSNKKLTLAENGKTIASYENYDKLSYIKEEIGGVWEVGLEQSDKCLESKVATLEAETGKNATNLEQAIAELTMAFATLVNVEEDTTDEEVVENV